MIGLGTMGINMARRLFRSTHTVIAYNRSPGKTDEIADERVIGTYSLQELVEKLSPPGSLE